MIIPGQGYRNEFREAHGCEIVGGEIHKVWRMRKRGQRFPEFLVLMIEWMVAVTRRENSG